MTMFPAEDDAGDERLTGPDADPPSSGEATTLPPDAEPSLPDDATTMPAAEPALPTDAAATPPAAEPSQATVVATPRKPALSSFGDAYAALHDDGPQRHGAALRYSVELLAYYYAAQGRRNPAQEAIRTLVTDRFDILDTPQFGLYAPKGQGAAVADAGLRIMDALNAESVADPVWAGGASSTEAQRRADYAEAARRGRWVMDITGRHAILRDAQGRSVLAGSNISRVRLKGVPVVGFVMNQADQVQPAGDAAYARRDSAAPVTLGADGGDVSTGEFDLAQATGSPMRDAMNARPNGALPGDPPIDVGSVPVPHPIVHEKGKRSVNIAIEGLRTPFVTSPVEGYRKHPNADVQYFNHGDEKEILEYIKKLPPDVQINLIGHSWGAVTATKVAAKSERRITVLVTIDPVSHSRDAESLAAARRNVAYWHNVNAAPRSTDPSDAIREVGGPWGEEVRPFVDSFINANENHGSFYGMMRTEQDGISGLSLIYPPGHPLSPKR